MLLPLEQVPPPCRTAIIFFFFNWNIIKLPFGSYPIISYNNSIEWSVAPLLFPISIWLINGQPNWLLRSNVFIGWCPNLSSLWHKPSSGLLEFLYSFLYIRTINFTMWMLVNKIINVVVSVEIIPIKWGFAFSPRFVVEICSKVCISPWILILMYF